MLVTVVCASVLLTLNTVQTEWQKATGPSETWRYCWLPVYLLHSYSVSFAKWAGIE